MVQNECQQKMHIRRNCDYNTRTNSSLYKEM